MWWRISRRCADQGATAARFDRRQLMAAGAGMLLVGPQAAAARSPDPDAMDLQTALRKTFGSRTATPGKVKLDLPAVAGSGNSVALTVMVDSPMTEADHVRRIHVFAESNPRPHILTIDLGPRAPRAEVSTRIRLSRSQSVLAFAETSDGRLWSGRRAVEVTVGACDSLMFRY